MRDFDISSLFLLCLFGSVALSFAQQDSGSGVDDLLDPCKKAYDACQQAWLDEPKDGDKCDHALQWQDCLRQAAKDGVCTGSEGQVEALDLELDTHCDKSATDMCKGAQDQCREQWTGAAAKDADADKCALAKDWRTCMDDYILQGRCRKVPDEVADEEQKSCEAAEAGSVCLTAVEKCKADWELKYTDTHPNSLKCKLAQDWDSCVQVAIVMDCKENYAPYPSEIARQEASCGVPDVVIDLCQTGKDLCKDAWSSSLGDNSRAAKDRCDAATSWQACLLEDQLQQQCDTKVQIPQEVSSALLEFCTPEDSGDDQSCSVLETACNKAFIFTDNDDKCDKATKWRSCLDAAQKKGCGVIIPATLESQLQLCAGKGACETQIESCRTEFENGDPSQDRCTQARKWRACLENLLGFCTVDFPRALDELQANSCYRVQSSVTCASLSTQCKRDYLDNVRVNGESCIHAEEWRKCLEDVSRKHQCNVQYPRELNYAQATQCYGRSNSAKSCSADQLKCKTAYDDAASSSDPCQNAREWRSCLENLMGGCTVKFPYQLNKAEATHCYQSGAAKVAATAGKDSSGARLSCKTRMSRCRTYSLTSESDRCEQAKGWRACLEGLRADCQVQYPRELDQLQAVHCYLRKRPAKPAPRPPKKTSKPTGKAKPKAKQTPPKPAANDCASKERRCKPANAKTCDDARKWRSCLDLIKDECGMKVFTRELNVLQATTCYGK